MKIVVCSLNIHDWEIVRETKYKELVFKRLGIPDQRRIRVCKKCGKPQEEEVHCLGLNPPKYVKTWLNISDSNKLLIEMIL